MASTKVQILTQLLVQKHKYSRNPLFQVVARNTLPPPAQDKFRQMLRGIDRVSQLIAVDRSIIQTHLAGAGGGGGEEEEAREMLAVWREVSRVRAKFCV